MGYNKGQFFLIVVVIIFIIGIAALGLGIMENKIVPISASQKTIVIQRYISPTPAYGNNIWPEMSDWGYIQPFNISIPAYKNNIWPGSV